MTKHIHIRDISRNFYKVTKDLSEPIVITSDGNPRMVITATNNSIVGQSQSSQVSANASSFSTQSVSLSQSSNFTPEESQKMIDYFKNFLGKEVQSEEENKESQPETGHDHNR